MDQKTKIGRTFVDGGRAIGIRSGVTQKAVVVVLVRAKGRAREVLLLRRAPHRDAAPGLWETVSGRVETGESPGHCAAREVQEETGIRAMVIGAEPCDQYGIDRAGVPMEVLVYAAHAKGQPDVRVSDEHDAFVWSPLDEPSRAEALEALRARGVPPRLVEAIDRAFPARPLSA